MITSACLCHVNYLFYFTNKNVIKCTLYMVALGILTVMIEVTDTHIED